MLKVERLIKEIRESANEMYNIFTQGSCFRLYCILKLVFEDAVPYWSGDDGHCITKIDGRFYDIGGVMDSTYVADKGYAEIPESLFDGYYLMKYDKNESIGVKPEKYKK